MPIYAKDIYGGGPQTLGFLLAAAGARRAREHALSRRPRDVRGLGRVIAAARRCAAASHSRRSPTSRSFRSASC